MRAAWLLLIPLAGIGLLAFAKSRKGKAASTAVFPKVVSPIIVSVPGYRRALSSEVTPAMQEAAVLALNSKFKLGTVIPSEGFAIGLENHYDEKRGWHRGASVFLPG